MSKLVTETERTEIVGLYDNGHTKEDLVRMTGRSKDCIDRIIRFARPSGKAKKAENPRLMVRENLSSAPWPDGWSLKRPTMAQLRAGR